MSKELPTGSVTYNGRVRKIKTWFEYPPIPTREHDYGACFEDWDLGDPSPCFGPTPEDALDQLIERCEAE